MRLLAQDLTCVRGGHEVFASLSFAVTGGEALAVTGANGAGKSSLLRMIAGLLPSASGHISLENGDDELSLAEQAHYLGHRDSLKPALSVRENLQFWQAFLGGELKDASAEAGATDALTVCGIGHASHLPAAFLSAGQRRRLSIARLLAVRRPIWLLDEPTSTLDADGQAVFSAIMAAHLADGGLIIAATHGPLGIPASSIRLGA